VLKQQSRRISDLKWLLQPAAATCWLWHGVLLERRHALAFNRPWLVGPWQLAESAISSELNHEESARS